MPSRQREKMGQGVRMDALMLFFIGIIVLSMERFVWK
jgi:hypothetical protein